MKVIFMAVMTACLIGLAVGLKDIQDSMRLPRGVAFTTLVTSILAVATVGYVSESIPKK